MKFDDFGMVDVGHDEDFSLDYLFLGWVFEDVRVDFLEGEVFAV